MSTVLLTSVVGAPAESGNVPGVSVTRVSISGERHAACIVEAVAAAYPRLDDPAAALRALDGQKVTVLRYGENMLGAAMIFTEEGTLFNGGGALLPKGKRRNGHRLGPDSVLDVVPGYNHAALATRVAAVRAQFPQVRELTKERVAALPGGSADCTLAVFGRWRMPHAVGHDAVWLLSGFLTDDEIVDGVLFVRPHVGVSEHGSIYLADLLAVGGEIVDAPVVSYAKAVEMTNWDHDAVLALLRGDTVT